MNDMKQLLVYHKVEAVGIGFKKEWHPSTFYGKIVPMRLRSAIGE